LLQCQLLHFHPFSLVVPDSHLETTFHPPVNFNPSPAQFAAWPRPTLEFFASGICLTRFKVATLLSWTSEKSFCSLHLLLYRHPSFDLIPPSFFFFQSEPNLFVFKFYPTWCYWPSPRHPISCDSSSNYRRPLLSGPFEADLRVFSPFSLLCWIRFARGLCFFLPPFCSTCSVSQFRGQAPAWRHYHIIFLFPSCFIFFYGFFSPPSGPAPPL